MCIAFRTITTASANKGKSRGKKSGTPKNGGNYGNKQVFSIHSKITISMDEVMTAYDMCSSVSNPRHRWEMYAFFGIDGEAIDQYLDVVVNLNRIYKTLSTESIESIDM